MGCELRDLGFETWNLTFIIERVNDSSQAGHERMAVSTQSLKLFDCNLALNTCNKKSFFFMTALDSSLVC